MGSGLGGWGGDWWVVVWEGKASEARAHLFSTVAERSHGAGVRGGERAGIWA